MMGSGDFNACRPQSPGFHTCCARVPRGRVRLGLPRSGGGSLMPSSCALARGRLLLCVAAVAQARQVDRWRVFLYLACLRSLGSMVERVGTAGTVYNQALVFAGPVYRTVEGKGLKPQRAGRGAA